MPVAPKEDENNKNMLNYEKSLQPDDSGFLSKVSSLTINSHDLQAIPAENKIPYRPIASKSRTQLFSSENSQPKPASVAPTSQKKEEKEPHKVEVIKMPYPPTRKALVDTRMPISLYKPITEDSKETPLKKSQDFQFVTPSARPMSAIKERSSEVKPTIERPKILFTTPVSVQRKLSPLKEVPSVKPTAATSINENILVINSVEYLVDKKIGSGGSSLVYLAKGKKSSKECAIKVVNLDGDAQMIEGYLNETKLLARLQRNINVVELFDYCHLPEKKTLYMIMEKGESDLHRILQSYSTHIPLYILMNYWHQMLQAVNYIHQNGVIHSDLKPANFLIVNGRLKLIDFGIASNIALDSTSIIKFSQAGTFNYISPEALIDTSTGDSPAREHQPRIRLSTRSDVWSLGCILYLLLYKKTPFSHIKQLPQKITAITSPNTLINYPELPNFYPPLLLEMLKKCLIYHPKQRPLVADLLKYPFEMVIPIDK